MAGQWKITHSACVCVCVCVSVSVCVHVYILSVTFCIADFYKDEPTGLPLYRVKVSSVQIDVVAIRHFMPKIIAKCGSLKLKVIEISSK